MGDVAMTIPVLYSFAARYPEHEIRVLSRRSFAPLFGHRPPNLKFVGVDLEDYRGIGGLERLFRILYAGNFDAVADLHDVLRTKFLRFRFRLKGVKAVAIDKGRREKRRLTRRKNKICRPLKTSFERYAEVLHKLGYPFDTDFRSVFGEAEGDSEVVRAFAGEKGNDKWVGIAPFAKHKGKTYPPALMQEVIEGLSACGIRIFLFGGGRSEIAFFEAQKKRFPELRIVAGAMDMGGELELMNRLDCMLSMDSANMHMASLTGTPVVSIWGATHPYAGFMGWNQKEAVQLEMDCRPCSVFGNKPCLRGDYACMYGIRPNEIVDRIKTLLYETNFQD